VPRLGSCHGSSIPPFDAMPARRKRRQPISVENWRCIFGRLCGDDQLCDLRPRRAATTRMIGRFFILTNVQLTPGQFTVVAVGRPQMLTVKNNGGPLDYVRWNVHSCGGRSC
jgi:hypothetical protein